MLQSTQIDTRRSFLRRDLDWAGSQGDFARGGRHNHGHGLVHGNFATGLSATNVSRATGDFATGVRNSRRLTSIGDFATGMRTVAATVVLAHGATSHENELDLAA
jgi:hypothetical protein